VIYAADKDIPADDLHLIWISEVFAHLEDPLGVIGDPGAVPALIGALRDDERKVGLEASHALRDIGPPALVLLRQAEAPATGGMQEALSEIIGETEDRVKRREKEE
jgi:HEAT repeat protein